MTSSPKCRADHEFIVGCGGEKSITLQGGDDEQLETFHTAAHCQMIHAIGIILVGLLNLHNRSRWFDAFVWTMLVGIVLFSGRLYAWLATGRKFFVHPVPVGGTLFIIGWLLLAIGALGFFGSK